jgi:hypothetical protein
MSDKATVSSQKELNTSNNSNSQSKSETANLFQGSQHDAASSSSYQIENIPELFADSHNDISLFLKKYSEAYAHSEQDEQKILDDLDAFYQFILEFQSFLALKLKTYREKITKFSKVLVTSTASPSPSDFSNGVQ